MRRFFEPIRLPFTLVKLPSMPYYVRALLLGVLRGGIALLLGPEAYFLARGRIAIALSVFMVKMGFALFKHDETGRSWMIYLALGAEAVQFILSLYVGYRLTNAEPTVEMVEQVEVVDEKGNLIRTFEKKLTADEI